MKSKKILVTGFKPFLGEKINPSSLLIERLLQNHDLAKSLVTAELPVIFSEAASQVLNILESFDPNIVVMLGQAGGRPQVCLERVALNWIETQHPDEAGICPPLGSIMPGKPKAYLTELRIEEWRKNLQAENLPVAVSLSAGAYVCNHIYYTVLDKLSQSEKPLNAVFIHVPYVPEQTVGKVPSPPSLDIEIQYKIITRILEMALTS